MQVRYDPVKEIYRDCKWCNGRGCLACPGEAEKDYKRAFPDGPQPIAMFDLSTEDGKERARLAIGAEAMKKAFSPSGGGIQEIMSNAAALSKANGESGDAASNQGEGR